MKISLSGTARLFVSSILHNFKGIPWQYQYKLGKLLQITIFKGLGNRGQHGLPKNMKKSLEENLEKEDDSQILCTLSKITQRSW